MSGSASGRNGERIEAPPPGRGRSRARASGTGVLRTPLPVVHAEMPRAERRWKRFVSVTSAWMPGSSPGMTEKGKNEKRFGGETPTDATVVRRAVRARPRLHTGGAHLSAFHHGSCLGDRTPPLSFSPRYLGWGP